MLAHLITPYNSLGSISVEPNDSEGLKVTDI